MKNSLNVLLIIIFLFLLIIPLVFADYPGGKVSIVENRYLASFPSLHNESLKQNLHSLHQGLNNWINDNAGGRVIASDLITKIQYYCFGISAKSDSLIGKDKWFFYYTPEILDDFTGTNVPINPTLLSNTCNNMSSISTYLSSKGITTLFVLIPDKKTIYREQYPSGIKNPYGIYASDQIQEYLNNNSILNYFDLRSFLFMNKSKGTLYSQQIDNAHWNYLGAFLGTTEICKELSKYDSRIKVQDLKDCTIIYSEEKTLFNGSIPISESCPFVSTGFEKAITNDDSFLEQFPMLTYNGRPDVYKKRFINVDNNLPKILFIGDSYSEKMVEYLSQSFSETTFLHTADLPHMAEIIDVIKPDFVLIESVERMLPMEVYEISVLGQIIESL